MMADLSDSCFDLIRYYKIITKNKLDAVFGSRFLDKSKISDYPLKKLILNRIFNYFVKIVFSQIIMILQMHLKYIRENV